jgi:hypothetical protein
MGRSSKVALILKGVGRLSKDRRDKSLLGEMAGGCGFPC